MFYHKLNSNSFLLYATVSYINIKFILYKQKMNFLNITEKFKKCKYASLYKPLHINYFLYCTYKV